MPGTSEQQQRAEPRCCAPRSGQSFLPPSEYVLHRFRWTMPWELDVRWCACGDCARLEELADVGPSSWRDTHSCFSPPFCCSVPHSFSFCLSLQFLISEELSLFLWSFLSLCVKRRVVFQLGRVGEGDTCEEFSFPPFFMFGSWQLVRLFGDVARCHTNAHCCRPLPLVA